jgi:predicted DNA-binding protein
MKYDRLSMPKSIPVRLDKPLLDRIKALSDKIGEAQSTVMRMAMRVGLVALEKTFEADPADLVKLVSSLEPPKKSSGYPPQGQEVARAQDKPTGKKPKAA